jgi:hypothetical protein
LNPRGTSYLLWNDPDFLSHAKAHTLDELSYEKSSFVVINATLELLARVDDTSFHGGVGDKLNAVDEPHCQVNVNVNVSVAVASLIGYCVIIC